MGDLLYQHPDDDLAKGVVPTISVGAVDANYPVSNLSNDNPALPAKFTGGNVTLDYDLGSAVAVPLIAFLHWNVRSPATVTVKADNVSTFDSGSLITESVTLTTVGGHGYWPNPFLDRRDQGARRYLRIVIASNPEPVVIGGIWLGSAARALAEAPQYGLQRSSGLDAVVMETSFRVRHAFNRAAFGGFRGGVIRTTMETGLPALRAWIEACRFRARPFLLIYDTADGVAQLVTWDQDELVDEQISPEYVDCPVAWRDVSPGEAWD